MENSRILIVEDEVIIAKDIQNKLEHFGYTIAGHASTGEEAINMAIKHEPSLILMDIILKGSMDGIEASKKIKSHLNVPIIYLTAYSDKETIERAKLTEPYGYIIKPFNEKDLYNTIEIVLYRHSLEKKLIDLNQNLEKQVQERTSALEKANKELQDEITKRTIVEDEVTKSFLKEKEANSLRSRFVSMVSHDFRTPLAAILSSVELLEHYNEKLSKTEQEQIFHRIRNSINRMTGLLDNILIIGRAEAGKLVFNPREVDIKKLCKNMADEFKSLSKDRIRFISHSTRSNIYSDEILLRHILSNLLSNAIKYSPNGGNIIFLLTCSDEEAVIEIQDNGIGIREDDIDSIFEPFQRGKNTGNIHGTGLGLSIVKKCIDLCGGIINITSKLNKETNVKMTIPAKGEK